MTKIVASLNSFNYFLLKLESNVELAELKNKLINLKTLDQNFNNLVLSASGKLSLEKLKIIQQIIVEQKFNLIALEGQYDFTAPIAIVKFPTNLSTEVKLITKSKIIDQPVRSGMRIEHDGDIVINSFVSEGAEVVAQGNIHIYGEARGRLMAGAYGDKTNRIFVQQFNPELISIAGIYRPMEEKLPNELFKKPVMVHLDAKQKLIIKPI